MDDRQWERLRRRAKREKWWHRFTWFAFTVNMLCAAVDGFRAEWWHTLWDLGLATLMLWIVTRKPVPLIRIEDAVEGEA
jgi:hypothetical protein